MQYVGQTCRALQKRFGEHYRRMKKLKPIDTFLYQHFKLTVTFPVQPLTGFIFLNLFGLLECLVMWLILMPVIKV